MFLINVELMHYFMISKIMKKIKITTLRFNSFVILIVRSSRCSRWAENIHHSFNYQFVHQALVSQKIFFFKKELRAQPYSVFGLQQKVWEIRVQCVYIYSGISALWLVSVLFGFNKTLQPTKKTNHILKWI